MCLVGYIMLSIKMAVFNDVILILSSRVSFRSIKLLKQFALTSVDFWSTVDPSQHTVCPRILDPIYIVSCYIKWVKTSWTLVCFNIPDLLFIYLLSFASCSSNKQGMQNPKANKNQGILIWDAFHIGWTEYYRKSVVHLLKRTWNNRLLRCSAVIYETPSSTGCLSEVPNSLPRNVLKVENMLQQKKHGENLDYKRLQSKDFNPGGIIRSKSLEKPRHLTCRTFISEENCVCMFLYCTWKHRLK